ncbi:ROK family transcriptional regulator [Gynuella sp.]|uniref:ROK family transcriptional regulator n=1 Tax=Gynuella sp. TaxID=2969146 RepID=UPI003D0E75A6
MSDLTGSNAEQAAEHNRAVVLQAIYRNAPISRTELAQQAGLTKQAITRIVDRLLDEGLVMEARRRQGQRGQPAIELEIDPEGVYAIGANIDRDHLTVIAMDATGTVRGRIHHEKRFILPDEFSVLMEDAISSFSRRRIVDEARLAGIGLAIPDWLGEIPVIGRPTSYCQWNDFEVRKTLETLTSHPVFIDNDANCAAMGELEYGLGTEISSFFYILANACLGGGLILNGRQHQGTTGLNGEVGWLPILTDEGPAAGQIRPLGEQFSLFLLYDHLAQHGIQASKPADLLKLGNQGNQLISRWLRQISLKVAEAILHIGLIVDPAAIVIGGRFPVKLMDELVVYLHEALSDYGTELPSLHRAVSSEDAAALGAATMPLAHAFNLSSAQSIQLTRVPLTSS